MEQDKLPCGDGTPHMGFDREVFERVWRRVMPEDRPDCPFLLEDAPPQSQSAPAPTAPMPSQDWSQTGMEPRPVQRSGCPGRVMRGEVMVDEMPPLSPLPNYPQQAMQEMRTAPAQMPMVKSDLRPIQPDRCCENDVPCLGAASAIHGSQLQDFIDQELSDWRTYMALAKRAQGTGGKVLSSMAADEKRHAKRLSTAYFLISGVRYWPVERVSAMPAGTYMGALRQRFCMEQKGESAYLAAAESTTDPCLRELFEELSGEENAHTWLLRGILEQL